MMGSWADVAIWPFQPSNKGPSFSTTAAPDSA
jgi:hypothetical protein